MALEAEEDLPTVATANLTEAEVVVMEEHQHTAEEHLVMALQTCISRPRMVVATHSSSSSSSSLNTACLSKVFQNQTVAIVGACSFVFGKC